MDNFQDIFRKILVWLGFANSAETEQELTQLVKTQVAEVSNPRPLSSQPAIRNFFSIPAEFEYYLSSASHEKLLRLALDHILQAPAPIRTEEICANLFEKIPVLARFPIYHPHKSYSTGDILFHGWHQQWFIIQNLQENKIDMLFIDGEQKKYAHGKSYVSDFPTTAADLFESKLNDLLTLYWKNSDAFYHAKDRWYFRPFIYPDEVISAPNLPKTTPILDVASVLYQRVRRCDEFTEFSLEAIDAFCHQYHVQHFFHITHIDNLPGILQAGLLSHNNCTRKGALVSDISNHDIQSVRHTKIIKPYPNLRVHDCVPLFVASKPPMLSALREQQNEIIYLHIDPNVLRLNQVIFTDGNARSNRTRFFYRPAEMAQLDWSVLNAHYWSDPDPVVHDENKRKRSAEILVPECVPVSFIFSISARNQETAHMAKKIVAENHLEIPVRTDLSLYY